MSAFFKKITQRVHQKGVGRSFSYESPVSFHWKLLLVFFCTLLIGIAIGGLFLYRFFMLETLPDSFSKKTAEALFDEKKLNEVLKRIEGRKTFEGDTGTGTPRFIDPSIPF